jgi:hypothetical protein
MRRAVLQLKVADSLLLTLCVEVWKKILLRLNNLELTIASSQVQQHR